MIEDWGDRITQRCIGQWSFGHTTDFCWNVRSDLTSHHT